MFTAFKNWYPTNASSYSEDSNILVVDEDRFDNDVEHDFEKTVVLGGAGNFVSNSNVSRYGTSDAHETRFNLLVGVGLNYGAGWGDGRVYEDSSVADGYIRTPMTPYYDSDYHGWDENSCGTRTYRTNVKGTYDLEYADCAYDFIQSNL